MENTTIVRCVVAAMTANGPDFFFCKVRCSLDDYNNGVHYEIAEDAAENDGFDGPMLAYDENDGHDWLFDHFEWDSASIVEEDDDDDDEDDDDDDEDDDEDDD